MKSQEFIKMLGELSDEEKSKVRELLGVVVKQSNPGTRISGKVQGTGKPIEVKIAKQMEILIKSLPVDKPVDINEWANLAVTNGLLTCQPPVRIAAYYKAEIVKLGFATTI